MARRILLADGSDAVLTALRKDLEPACELEAAAPGAAAARAGADRFDVAVVRGTAGARTVAALRAADPLLPVVVLFLDRREAAANPGAGADADAVLVGPLTASAVGTACALAGELRLRAERIAELEGRLARPARSGRELEFLKRLLLAEVKRSRRYGYPIALALLAVDVRDGAARPGARARSALLADALGIVRGALRDIDVALPFADERLVVLMPHTKEDGAMRVARRLCARVREKPGFPRLAASVGVAAHAGDGTVSFAALVRRASDALARARAAGGDRAEAADPPKRRDRISIG
jgi:two-component system cell cycle response regulator